MGYNNYMGITQKKIKEYEERLKKLEKEFGLKPAVSIEFPQYRELPDEVLLALRVLEKHDYKLMLSYMEDKE